MVIRRKTRLFVVVSEGGVEDCLSSPNTTKQLFPPSKQYINTISHVYRYQLLPPRVRGLFAWWCHLSRRASSTSLCTPRVLGFPSCRNHLSPRQSGTPRLLEIDWICFLWSFFLFQNDVILLFPSLCILYVLSCHVMVNVHMHGWKFRVTPSLLGVIIHVILLLFLCCVV